MVLRAKWRPDTAWMDDTWTFILHYYAEEEIGDRFQLEPYLIYLKIFWIAGCLSEVCVLQKGGWRCLKAFIQTKFSKFLACYYPTNECIFKFCWQLFSNKMWLQFFLFAWKIFETRFEKKKTNQEIKLNGLILLFCKRKPIKQQEQKNNCCCENLSHLHRVCIDFEIRTWFLWDIHLQWRSNLDKELEMEHKKHNDRAN